MANPEKKRPHLVFVVTVDISINTFFRGQFRYLQESGFDVTLISSPGPGQRIAADQGAKVIAVPMKREISPWHDIVSLLLLWQQLRRLKPDMVIVGSPKAGLIGGIAALLARVPCRIYLLLGLRLETTTGWKRRILTVAERIACSCAHQVVAVSPSLRRRAIQLRLVDDKFVTIFGHGTANGVDCIRFQATPENLEQARILRRTLGINAHAPVVGFVGRLTRDKGIRELYDAFVTLRSRFPEARLLLIGDFEEGDSVGTKLQGQLLADTQISIRGFVENTAPYYLAMDLLAFPTYREGFGNVSVEAQACSVPVVTTNATGAIDSVRDGRTGFIVPVGDSAALGDAMCHLLAEPALRKEMGKAGAAWVRDNFSAQSVWRDYARGYSAALGKQSQGQGVSSGLAGSR